ncbi:MAG: NifU family protein [Psychrilyobacter sp.]|nr:NifU family protein [Psychrilyobacter sp.]
MEKNMEIIEKILKEKVRPILNEHRGDIKIISYKSNILTIKLIGSCSGCSEATATTEHIVKKIILEENIGVLDVILDTGVSDDLMDMARQLLSKK